MALFFPFRFRFEFDPDEGIQAVKAMLHLRGFALHTEVWSDHPPVFTLLLSLVFRMLGVRVVAARLLVLGLSTLALLVSMRYMRLHWSHAHGAAAALLIVLLPYYPVLSVSVMIGLPAIALALAALLCAASWHRGGGARWLILSGMLLGLSTMVKLFTLVAAPALVAGLIYAGHTTAKRPGTIRAALAPALIWSAGFVAVVGIFLVRIVGPENWQQLVGIHLAAGTAAAFDGSPTAGDHLRSAWPLMGAALLGWMLAAREHKLPALHLGGWAVLAWAFLALNRPVWYHHQLLIMIPAALLASVAAGEGLAALARIRRGSSGWDRGVLVRIAGLALVACYALSRIGPAAAAFDLRLPNVRPPAAAQDEAEYVTFAAIAEPAGRATWLLTDRPMFAVRTGVPVPPALAVLSGKRLATGLLTEQDLIQALEAYRPELVLLGRFEFPALEGRLSASVEYSRVYVPGYRLYARDSLVR
jgi:4-amino-4-deoxy-L-arabinose transferase-like glycosyltransferase